MKTLNIEALAKSNRTLTIAGKTYDVEEMTVENFIATTKEIERLGDKPSFIDQLESSIAMIVRYVPTIDRSVLVKLDLTSLMTIIKFVRGDMDEPVAAEVAAIEGSADSSGK